MAKLPPSQQNQLADSLMAKNKTGALSTEPNPQYRKPTVVEAPNDVLDPSVADPAGVTVKVGYDLMVTSDRIKVTFNGYVFAPIGGSADREVQLSVPAAQVAATVGKHVEVSYTVVRPSGPIDSMPLDLEVQTMPAASLPAPEITQAQDGVLDLTAFTGAADLTVKKVAVVRHWAAGLVDGEWDGGVPSLNILNGYPILASEAADGIARDIARSELEKYADGDVMTVVCKVAFDGAAGEAGAVAFPPANYVVNTLPPLELDPSDMILDGVGVLLEGGLGICSSAGNRKTRTPVNGSPPYTYTSGNSNIARVDTVGSVTGWGNGTTSIIITDTSQRQATYTVVVSNVFRLAHHWERLDHQGSVSWCQSIGGHAIDQNIRNQLRADAFSPYSFASTTWCCDPISLGNGYFSMVNGKSFGLSQDLTWGAACLLAT